MVVGFGPYRYGVFGAFLGVWGKISRAKSIEHGQAIKPAKNKIAGI
jgi:hypothetical protein